VGASGPGRERGHRGRKHNEIISARQPRRRSSARGAGGGRGGTPPGVNKHRRRCVLAHRPNVRRQGGQRGLPRLGPPRLIRCAHGFGPGRPAQTARGLRALMCDRHRVGALRPVRRRKHRKSRHGRDRPRCFFSLSFLSLSAAICRRSAESRRARAVAGHGDKSSPMGPRNGRQPADRSGLAGDK